MHSSSLDADPGRQAREGRLDRLGIPSVLAWGFVGVLLFMIGDGVESGYLSPYLVSRGLSEGAVASVFTVYGVSAAAAAGFRERSRRFGDRAASSPWVWCSGSLSRSV